MRLVKDQPAAPPLDRARRVGQGIGIVVVVVLGGMLIAGAALGLAGVLVRIARWAVAP